MFAIILIYLDSLVKRLLEEHLQYVTYLVLVNQFHCTVAGTYMGLLSLVPLKAVVKRY